MSERHNLLRMDDDAETGFRSEFGTVGMPSLPPATPRINHEREIYPYCIVWTPLPMISWFLPFIGHTGIGDSRGVIHDFAGPYHIGVGNLAFSKPTKYLQLDPSKCFAANWDDGLKEGCDCYRKRMHNICCDNCHSHVAKCLNVMAYNKVTTYGMFHIGAWVFFSGRWVSFASFIRTYTPFAIIVAIIVLASSGVFS